MEALGQKELLLCLDNLEQLLDAAPFVGELLARCPGLRLLVTSRSPLNLAGEREYPLAPLHADEALELFAARARAVSPDFSRAPSTRRRCARSASASTGCRSRSSWPPAACACSRRRGFSRGSSRRSRCSPAARETSRSGSRRSALRSTGATSCSSRTSSACFATVSVFLGGFDLEAAVAVSAQNELELLDPLSALIEHSLVRRREQDGEPRFFLLETIREFAAEQLEASGEADETRRRHAEYYLDFAEPGSLPFDTDELTEWLSRAELERANLRAALGWLIEHGTVRPGAPARAGASPRCGSTGVRWPRAATGWSASARAPAATAR